ncbi:MAG: transporter substrate-binding domain-containing protein, partial [Hyphomicrobiaceae bacterium]
AAGQSLTVMTIERRPFSSKTADGYSGFSVDLWTAIAKDRGWTFTWQDAASFKEMLGAVEGKSADLAIANISITAAREQIMDFSQPVFDAGLQILVPEEGSATGVLSAILTWDMLGWLLTAGLLLFVVGNLMWFFERRSQPYFETTYKDSLWPSFWWALNLLINGGFEERVPRSLPGRVFGTLLVVASLFVVSAFVAKITSALTVGQLKAQVQSYNDLYGRRVGTTAGSTAAVFLEKHAVRHRTFASVDALFGELESGTLDAVVHDAPIVAYYAATIGKGRFQTVGPILQPEKYGIALRQGSPLTEPINLSLLRLRENGTYATLVKRWFGDAYE